MRSELIDFGRASGEFAGALVRDADYLVMPGRASRPARSWRAPIGQLRLLDLLDSLGYGDTAREAGNGDLRNELIGLVTGLLGDLITDPPDETTQYDLVFRAAELCALPFEAALDIAGHPLFIRTDPRLIITRRVRSESFREAGRLWPAVPRVLYAWAQPDAEVPESDHRSALMAALRPWVEPLRIEGFREAIPNPTPSGIFTEIPNATLADIRDACFAAAESKEPFSHIHLLAHGRSVGDGQRTEFAIALQDGDVRGQDLAAAVCPADGEPTVVTLAACDSGNITNPVVGSSVAQTLHTSGVAVVVGSQLPLTIAGSTVFVRRFYRSLFSGEDVRCALHDARVALWDSREESRQDWFSLFGYVQLPEGYSKMLATLRMAAELASLKTARSWYDLLTEKSITTMPALRTVEGHLGERIENLTHFLADEGTGLSQQDQSENQGLLGSAHKRRAELLWGWDGTSARRGDARQSLEAARDSYRDAFFANPASHWNAVQYLSLQAVLEGTIDPQEWQAAAFAVKVDTTGPEYWRCGSRAELNLLATKAGLPEMIGVAETELKELCRLVAATTDTFPIESTRDQLQRYVTWWTKEAGFFAGGEDLTAAAVRLAGIVDSPSAS